MLNYLENRLDKIEKKADKLEQQLEKEHIAFKEEKRKSKMWFAFWIITLLILSAITICVVCNTTLN